MSTPTDLAYTVPFGKYAGEPLPTLLADSAYCRWLVQQPWVFDQHPELCTVVVEHMATRPRQPRPRRRAADLPRDLNELRFDFSRL